MSYINASNLKVCIILRKGGGTYDVYVISCASGLGKFDARVTLT